MTDRGSQTPPDGFKLLAAADLAAQDFNEETLTGFTLGETAVVTLDYTLPDIQADLDLRLKGANNDTFVILHSQDFRTDGTGETSKCKH